MRSPTEPIVSVSAALLERVAPTLKITNHLTGETSPWVPNEEQRISWRAQEVSRWYYVLKARQIGETTGQCLVDVLFTAINTANGHKVETWLVWDKEENVQKKIALCGDFIKQLGISARVLDLDIVFANGSAIRGLTAGGSRVGASQTCHRLHLSELPNWPAAGQSYDALMQSLLLEGRVGLETTMLVGNEGGALAKHLWETPNQYRKIFHNVEVHDEYRRDPMAAEHDPETGAAIPLAQDIEDWLRTEGFHRRDTMAWMQWALHNKVKHNDRISLLREYPQLPEHCFTLAEGRWYRCNPEVLTHESILEGQEMIKVYQMPDLTSGYLVMGVDTGGGLGRDRNAVAVVDRKTGRLVASYVDAYSTHRELALVVKRLQEMYTCNVKVYGRRNDFVVPPALIESNSIGRPTVNECAFHGVVYEEIHTTDGSRLASLTAARAKAEEGIFYGPIELSEEADELHVRNGKFKGRKDLSMAAGFCYDWMDRNPVAEAEPPANTREVAHFADTLRRSSNAHRWARRL